MEARGKESQNKGDDFDLDSWNSKDFAAVMEGQGLKEEGLKRLGKSSLARFDYPSPRAKKKE